MWIGWIIETATIAGLFLWCTGSLTFLHEVKNVGWLRRKLAVNLVDVRVVECACYIIRLQWEEDIPSLLSPPIHPHSLNPKLQKPAVKLVIKPGLRWGHEIHRNISPEMETEYTMRWQMTFLEYSLSSLKLLQLPSKTFAISVVYDRLRFYVHPRTLKIAIRHLTPKNSFLNWNNETFHQLLLWLFDSFENGLKAKRKSSRTESTAGFELMKHSTCPCPSDFRQKFRYWGR